MDQISPDLFLQSYDASLDQAVKTVVELVLFDLYDGSIGFRIIREKPNSKDFVIWFIIILDEVASFKIGIPPVESWKEPNLEIVTNLIDQQVRMGMPRSLREREFPNLNVPASDAGPCVAPWVNRTLVGHEA